MVFISHGDCLEDAEMLADKLRKTVDQANHYFKRRRCNRISFGPGTLAIFFIGKHR